MSFLDEFLKSLRLLVSSSEVWKIAGLSIYVSLTAVIISMSIGIPIGISLGLKKKNNKILVALINTGMGLPPVVVGLIVFLIIRRSGPLGLLDMLFSPLAMIIAQAVLTLPIIIGITRTTIRDLPDELDDVLISLGADQNQRSWQILFEGSSGILLAIMAALGRAFSEVGAIIIVGGNIRYHTRVLTTAIITYVSAGDNASALAMGIILLAISFTITSFATMIQLRNE